MTLQSLPGILSGSLHPNRIEDLFSEFKFSGETTPPSQGLLEFPVKEFKTIQELISEYDLAINPTKEFRFDQRQIDVISDFLNGSAHTIWEGGTGSGKTVIALIAASWFLKRGKPVLFTAPTHELIRQPFEIPCQVLGINESLYGYIAQGTKDKEIEQLLSDNRKLLLGMTPQQAIKLLELGKLNLEDGLIISDEFYKVRGNTAAAELIAKRPKSTRVLGLAAKLSESEKTIRHGKKQLTDTVFQKITVSDPLRLSSTIKANLSNELKEAAFGLKRLMKDELLNLLNSLEDSPEIIAGLTEALEIKGAYQNINFTVSTIGKLLPIVEQISKEPSIRFGAKAHIWKFQRLFHYYTALTVYGSSEFIANVIEQERIYIKKVADAQKNGKAKPRFNASKEITETYEFQRLFDGLTKGTKFEGFLQGKIGMPSREDIIHGLVDYPKFFHPKEEILINKLKTLPESVLEQGVIIYSGRVLTAKLLSLRLNKKLSSIKAGHLVGEGRTKKEREYRVKVFDEFRQGELNLISGTETIVQGFDSSAAAVFIYSMPNEAHEYEQLIGRTGRRGEIGYIYVLIADGTQDDYRFMAANRALSGKKTVRR